VDATLISDGVTSIASESQPCQAARTTNCDSFFKVKKKQRQSMIGVCRVTANQIIITPQSLHNPTANHIPNRTRANQIGEITAFAEGRQALSQTRPSVRPKPPHQHQIYHHTLSTIAQACHEAATYADPQASRSSATTVGFTSKYLRYVITRCLISL
jgi:hypothetical protein